MENLIGLPFIHNQPTPVDIEKIHFSPNEGLSLVVASRNDRKFYRVEFKGALFFQSMDESFYLKRWNSIEYDTSKVLGKSTSLFESKDSKLLDWLIEMSCNVLEQRELNDGSMDLKHFVILTDEQCVDILGKGTFKVHELDSNH